MPDLTVIKRILAMMLLACLFLPLSQCSIKSQPESGTQAAEVETTETLTPYKAIEFKSIDELGLVMLFLWPIPLLIARTHLIKRQQQITLSIIEIGVSLFCLYYLWLLFGLWQIIRVGGYLALASFTTYAAVSALALFYEFKK